MKVVDTHRLVPGAEMMLSNFQIAASGPDGVITMVNADITEEQERSDLVGYEVRPGCWRVTPEEGMQPLSLPDEAYYETDTARELLRHFDAFVNKLDVYRKYNLPPRRGILMGGDPGTGKSSLIRHFSRGLRERPKTCILRLDSQNIPFETLTHMLMNTDTDKVNLILLVIEDLGGTATDERGTNVTTTMLNFLDGNRDVYRVPTMIVATTNYLDTLQETLTSRPGRFDVVTVVQPPKFEEVCFLVESVVGRQLTDLEKDALRPTNFTPAYCIESVIRSELYDMSLEAAVEELKKQRERAKGKNHMSNSKMGFDRDEDY
jgi:hypothetical protein